MSRNKLMLLNLIAVLCLTILNTILGLFEIGLFIRFYGSEINGIIQTATQLAIYLSLIEGGIGAAFLYSMYKPISDSNYDYVSSLYKGFKVSINNAVKKMIFIAIIVSLIYPLVLLINNKNSSYWFLFTVFILILFRTILPYKISLVPKYMIILQEKKYLVEVIRGLTISFSFAIQISAILLFKPNVIVLLIVTLVFTLLSGFFYKIVMEKLYRNKINYKRNPDFSPRSNSKFIIAHNISSIVFNSTDNLVISFFSISQVTIFSSYNMIVQTVSDFIFKIIDGSSSTFGIKVASNDKNISEVSKQLVIGLLFIGSILSTGFVLLINDFVAIWIGETYLLNDYEVYLFAFLIYLNSFIPLLNILRNAKGLFKESLNFIVFQSILNLVLTIILVPILGIFGALIGTIIPRVLITIPMNVSLIKRNFLSEKFYFYRYYLLSLLFLLLISTLFITNRHIFDLFPTNPVKNLFFKSFIIGLILSVIYLVLYYVSFKHYRTLITKIFKIFKR